MDLDRRHAMGLLAASAVVPALNPLVAEAKTVQTPNVLTQPWSGPYGGVPAFDKVKLALFEPAFDEAMVTSRAEIAAIVKNPAKPDFENTMLALELSGLAMNRLATVYFIWDSNLSSPQLQDISSRIIPKLSAFGDELTQNVALFARLEAVYKARDGMGLTSEQNRLLEETYKNFVRAGAKQNKATKTKIAAINQKLSTLYDTFGNNQLADESTYIELSKADLDGLSDGFIAGLSEAAKAKGKDGLYLVKNTRSAMEPFTTFSTRRDLREKVWRAYIMRGENGGATDNMAIIAEILKLRQQKAVLQGYPTFAHLNMDGSMAKVPENAMALMESVWGAAVARVKEEVADMQALADAEGANITIAPWDYRFYAEKVRKAKYDLDENEIKPYMQLEKLREGMFWAAGQNYGYSFEQIHDLPVFHEDVRTWKVKRDGKTIGVWYFDPYARDGKRSGAWMNAYREQSRPLGKEIITIVSNNSNFIKGAPGEPVLVSWDDAETLFHEFGHALHGLSANCTYASLSGTNVARDFVEFPSQINEHWLSTPEVLSKFAIHYKTGEAMPLALVDKIKKAATFNQGFKTVEFLGSALIDMKLHLAAASGPIDPAKFEKEELAKLGMPKEIVMRHRTAQFGHIFSGDGYAAGYYAYLWADTLTADAWEAFLEGEGPYDKAVAKRFFTEILSVGNTRDQAESYRAFRDRDVDTKALMRDRGFI
jgi:peptidyl-dipeptidase Dcp